MGRRRSSTTSSKDDELVKNICDICDKELSSKRALHVHQLVHFKEQHKLTTCKLENGELFLCHLCQRSYVNQYGLKQHLKIHDGTWKKFKCMYCDMRFNFDTSLRLHISNHHTKDKPFKCRTCGKTFGISSNLKNHERTHTGEKYYTCKYCKESFASTTKLTRHIQNSHFDKLIAISNREQQNPSNLKKDEVEKKTIRNTDALEIDSRNKKIQTQPLNPTKPKRRTSECVSYSKMESFLQRSDRNRRPPIRYTQSLVDSKVPNVKSTKNLGVNLEASSLVIDKLPSNAQCEKIEVCINPILYDQEDFELVDQEVLREEVDECSDDYSSSPIQILNTYSLAENYSTPSSSIDHSVSVNVNESTSPDVRHSLDTKKSFLTNEVTHNFGIGLSVTGVTFQFIK